MATTPQKQDDKPYSNKAPIIVIVTSVALMVLTIIVFLFSAQKVTEEGIYGVSEAFLEELTTQKITQFGLNLESQFQQLEVIVNTLQKEDMQSVDDLQDYIREMKQINKFEYFALVDEQGMVYTASETFPGISKFSFIGKELTEPLVFFDQSTRNTNMVMITIPVERTYDQHRLVAAITGMSSETVSQRLNLRNDTDQTYHDVISSNGAYVVHTLHNLMGNNSNFFSALSEDAVFGDTSSLEQFREDIKFEQTGLCEYTLNNMVHFTYYAPIQGTGWTMTTTVPYDIINDDMELVRTELIKNSLFTIGITVLAMCVVFNSYTFIRKRIERLYFEKLHAQAQEKIKAKDIFLSSMSHDIRTPMNAVIGFTNLALKDAELPQKTEEYLGKVLTSGNHLLALMDDVLQMSRMESGKTQLKMAAYSLNGIISELTDIMSTRIQNGDLEFVIHSDISSDIICCDKGKLSQVLLNLLSNSAKFTPQGGQITLLVKQSEVSEEGYAQYEFHVKDTGIGMSQDFQKKMFQPFEREQTATVSGIHGSGLGLAIVKSIVEMMDGTVECITAPNQGTEFIVSLRFKLEEAIELAEENAEKQVYDFTGKRILLVEDNELNREIAKEILEECGVTVETAEDGLVAVEQMKNVAWDYYDCILMDIQMPVMNGYDATIAIRSLEKDGIDRVKIIALTADAFPEDEAYALKIGMNGHVTKPIDTDKLLGMLYADFSD